METHLPLHIAHQLIGDSIGTIDLASSWSSIQNSSVHEINKYVDRVLDGQYSKALTIFGSVKEASGVVAKVLQRINDGYVKKFGKSFSLDSKYVARVNGDIIESDEQAFVSFVKQFLKRPQSEGSALTAVSDLEEHLRQCKMDNIPAFLIIENFHIFAKRKKQMLIYTLLNLMHNEEYYLMV